MKKQHMLVGLAIAVAALMVSSYFAAMRAPPMASSSLPTSSQPYGQSSEFAGTSGESDSPYVSAEPGAEPDRPEGAKLSAEIPAGMSWATYNMLVARGLEQLHAFDIFHNNPDTLPLDKATKIVLSIASKDKNSAKAVVDAASPGMRKLNWTIRRAGSLWLASDSSG